MHPPTGHITIDAAAVRVGVSRNTIARLCRAGKVASVAVAGRLFVNEAALLAYYSPVPVPVEVPNVR